MPSSASTRERIQLAAIELFEEAGFSRTTIAQVAARAEVSEMTVYRLFSTKAALVVDDPFDPQIVEAVAIQPRSLPPITRVIEALSFAVHELDESDDALGVRRARIVAVTPELAGHIAANNLRTQTLIADQLVADGAEPGSATIAAAAVLAAITTALLQAAAGDSSTADAVARALAVLQAAAS